MENTLLIGLSRQVTLERQMEVIANNVANVNTNGFKADQSLFQEYLTPTAREDNFAAGRDRRGALGRPCVVRAAVRPRVEVGRGGVVERVERRRVGPGLVGEPVVRRGVVRVHAPTLRALAHTRSRACTARRPATRACG